jgi:hypothetical protein
MSKENIRLYEKRLKRYVTACYNEKPDKIPIRIFAEEFAAKYCGYSNFEAACDHQLQFEVNRRFAVKEGCDAIQTNSIVNWMGMMKAIGWEGIKFPGIGLPVDTCNQWTEPTTEEDAFLKRSEYGAFSDDPTAFILEKWLPRFTTHIQQKGQAVTFDHNMAFVNGLLAYNTFFNEWGKAHGELIESGVVPAVGSVLKAPLDILGDKLRGYVNLSMDLLECREEVISTCEALMPHLLHVVLSGADPEKNLPSIIWMHRGSVPFISHEDFTDIYWATLKPIVEELWAHGHQLILYAEGDWTHHLEAINQLPEKSVIFHVDKTDLKEAHRILGNRFCLSGGLPNELLIYGTTEEVKAKCKSIIDDVAGDGGYIMDASALIMNDARIENVKAVIQCTREYGVYENTDFENLLLENIKDVQRPAPGENKFVQHERKPGTCVPWNIKRKEFAQDIADENLVRQTWENIDAQGYAYLWTNLTW